MEVFMIRTQSSSCCYNLRVIVRQKIPEFFWNLSTV